MSTRAERVEVILDAIIANDGERDRVKLAAAIQDALEPMLLADDRAARRHPYPRFTAFVAGLIILTGVVAVGGGVALLVVRLWP